jgi:hypothetical protein
LDIVELVKISFTRIIVRNRDLFIVVFDC